MKGVLYPYRLRLNSGGIESLPLVLCKLKARAGALLSILCLVDSGAQVTLLPRADAEELGLKLEKGEVVRIGGIGGEKITGYRRSITFEMGGISFKAPVVFAEREDVPRVLGREGIFGKFFILFDENKRRTALILRDHASEKFIEQNIIKKLITVG